MDTITKRSCKTIVWPARTIAHYIPALFRKFQEKQEISASHYIYSISTMFPRRPLVFAVVNDGENVIRIRCFKIQHFSKCNIFFKKLKFRVKRCVIKVLFPKVKRFVFQQNFSRKRDFKLRENFYKKTSYSYI